MKKNNRRAKNENLEDEKKMKSLGRGKNQPHLVSTQVEK